MSKVQVRYVPLPDATYHPHIHYIIPGGVFDRESERFLTLPRLGGRSAGSRGSERSGVQVS